MRRLDQSGRTALHLVVWIFVTIGVVNRADQSGGAHLRLDRRPRDREFVVDHIERLCDQLRKLG